MDVYTGPTELIGTVRGQETARLPEPCSDSLFLAQIETGSVAVHTDFELPPGRIYFGILLRGSQPIAYAFKILFDTGPLCGGRFIVHGEIDRRSAGLPALNGLPECSRGVVEAVLASRSLFRESFPDRHASDAEL